MSGAHCIPRRRAIRAGVAIGTCALLGTASTIAVAWAAALTIPLWSRDYKEAARRLTPAEGEGFLVVRRIETPASLFVMADIWGAADEAGDSTVARSTCDPSELTRGLGLACTLPWNQVPWPNDGSRYVEARGWPCLAVWCEVRYEYDPTNFPGSSQPELSKFRGGIAVPAVQMARGPNGWGRDAALPFRPLLRGFVLDTICYAAVWSVILFVPGGVRRSLRARRGLCSRCAYDLKGQAAPGCPECGWHRAPTSSGAAP